LDTEDYMPKYSAVIKLARLIIVQEIYKRQQESITYYESRRLNAKQARDKTNSYYIVTRRLVHTFITIAYNGKDPKPM
jgi:hypothetical protein